MWSAVADGYTAASGNWAFTSRPVRPSGGVHTGWKPGTVREGGDGREAGRIRPDLEGAGRRRRCVPGTDRAAPARAAGALLPDARILRRCRGRPSGHPAGRWQGIGGFVEGRASLRTWLYRIATNRCLNALRSVSRRPAIQWDVPKVEPPEPTRLGEVVWLEPYPDALLERALGGPPGPEARYEQTEAISLAFVTALQALPSRQLAVLILRDVLGFHASEVAGSAGKYPSGYRGGSRLRGRSGAFQRNMPAVKTSAAT